ncbi:MAG: hypothetical protein L3J16_04915 [Anaerolineales bacterium]|nr:hypothetical protein [Anaerolineales bacterium]
MQKKYFVLPSLLVLVLSACKPKTPLIDESIANAVAATIAAQPVATTAPTQTPYPTLTPQVLDLSRIFCEYQFCIGHPEGIALFDVRQAENPSSYGEGMLASYRPDLFILLIWQLNNGSADPQFMLELVMDDNLDMRGGTLDVSLLGDLTVFYVPISTNATEVLPYGGAAAWTCGDRAFGWKIYTPQADMAQSLFTEAMREFRCNE